MQKEILTFLSGHLEAAEFSCTLRLPDVGKSESAARAGP